MRKFLILILGLTLVAAACNTGGAQNKVNQIQSESEDKTKQLNDLGANDNTPGTVTINISSLGFVPANTSVVKGTTVKFLNGDNKDHWPASNPHPTHTGYPGFDSKQPLSPGESWSFVFDQVGTWGYHDHLNTSTKGVITVTE